MLVFTLLLLYLKTLQFYAPLREKSYCKVLVSYMNHNVFLCDNSCMFWVDSYSRIVLIHRLKKNQVHKHELSAVLKDV